MTADELAFDYHRLRYIKTRGPDDKQPLEKWGGYGQDFDAAETVYTHAEVADDDHDHWAVVDAEDLEHGSLATLVFDLDIHKAPEDFDPEPLSLPADTAVVRSQNGGLHIYFLVHAERGEFKEADFSMTADLGWDIDIRGSAVSAHVVAPADIPGVETPYKLVNDHSITGVFDPADAAERIRYDGESLLEFTPDRHAAADFSIDRDIEPPEDMPTCYHRGLQLRGDSPDDPHLNTHKVNVLTAMCGLAAGYDIETMVDHFCEEYPPDNADPDKTEYQLRHIAEKIDRDEYSPPSISTLRDYGILDESETCACDIPYHGRQSVRAIELDYSEVERGERLLESMTSPTDPAGELEHTNGGYGYTWVARNDAGEVVDSGFTAVTNFTLETTSYIDTYEGDLLNLRVHPAHPMEDAYEVQVHPKVFNDPTSFSEEIVRGRTTLFEPQSVMDKPAQQILNELRLTVAGQRAPDHIGTEYIGLHGDDYDEWVTPAGTLTADGWADEPSYVYYEKGGDTDMASSLEEKWQLDPEGGAAYDETEVRDICELLPWTRQPERGLPVLGWLYAAPLKPLITRESSEGEFNLLQVVGGTGTGKTSTLEVYYPLFGADPAPFGCGDKGFTIEKKLASSCGLPIWLDEYKPSDLAEGKLQWLHRRLRGVTRGQSYSKGLPSLGEVTFQMRAPVVFSGEQTIEEAAVRRRTIITQFSSGSTTGDYQRTYCELTGGSFEDGDDTEQYDGKDLYDHARAYYQFILSHSADEILDMWQTASEQTKALETQYDLGSLEGSERQGLRTIVFGFSVYKQFAREMGADADALPGGEELGAALEHVASNIGPDGRRREHIDEFTELVAQAALEGYLTEGEHYTLVDSRKFDTEVLAFHMPSTFSAVKRYVREFNVESEYSILGKNDYIDNYRDKAKQAGSYPLAVNQRVTGLENGHKAVYIDPERAAAILGDGFSLRAFGYYDDEEDEAADGDATDSAIPLSAVGSERGYVTTTVEVAALDADTPDGAPPLTGVVTDATGAVDILDWFGGVFEDQLEEEGTYRIRNARAGEYDGTPQLELVKGVTEIEEVQHGVGHLGSADSGDNKSLDTAADGGAPSETYEGVQGKIAQVFRDSSKDKLRLAAIAGQIDEPPETVKDGLENMARKGALIKRADNEYERR